MRRTLLLSILLTMPTVAAADEATDLRDKVTKACAKDAATLKKMRVYNMQAKGTTVFNGVTVPATHEITAEWPTKVRAAWEFGPADKKILVAFGATDDRGWRQHGPDAFALSIADLNDFRSDVYALWAATLVPLIEPDAKLSVVPPARLGGDTLVGLKLSQKPWPEVVLQFDEKTLLLRRMTYTSRDAGMMTKKEMRYEGHKDFDGLQLATKQSTMVDGKKLYEWTETKYTFPDAIDAKVFAIPSK